MDLLERQLLRARPAGRTRHRSVARRCGPGAPVRSGWLDRRPPHHGRTPPHGRRIRPRRRAAVTPRGRRRLHRVDGRPGQRAGRRHGVRSLGAHLAGGDGRPVRLGPHRVSSTAPSRARGYSRAAAPSWPPRCRGGHPRPVARSATWWSPPSPPISASARGPRTARLRDGHDARECSRGQTSGAVRRGSSVGGRR